MARLAEDLADRVRSLRTRAAALTELRALVALPPASDLTAEQWAAIEPRLAVTAERVMRGASRVAERVAARADDPAVARRMATALGHLELDLARAYSVFDTFVDVLTQRASPALGALLAGCDALAWDALCRPSPALRSLARPIVYCDRGFGASVVREGARMPDGGPSPIALVQIPYARLTEKLSLVSLLHEVGHQGLARLGLREPVSALLGRAASAAGASPEIAGDYARWSSEIGPDYWAFGCAGTAQPFALREIMGLPADRVLARSDHDPHPPPRLRVELGFELMRLVYGRGPWDDARAAFASAYPVHAARESDRAPLEAGRRVLPAIARALHEEPLVALGDVPLRGLFDFDAVHPERTRAVARDARHGRLALSGLRPSAHLAVFRWIREERWLAPEALERVMTRWLVALGSHARNVSQYPVWRSHARSHHVAP